MQLVLLTADLMLVSSAQGAANRRGATLTVASTPDAAIAACAPGVRLLAIDLRTPGLDIRRLLAELRAGGGTPIHVLASGPHVHEASLAAAAEAGCDEVVTRGEFDRRLDAALGRLAHA